MDMSFDEIYHVQREIVSEIMGKVFLAIISSKNVNRN